MKRYLLPLRNWRILLLALLAMFSFALIMGETDNLSLFLLIKAAGFALAYLCYSLAKFFDRRHLIGELNVYSENL